jgi:hypothetical protein
MTDGDPRRVLGALDVPEMPAVLRARVLAAAAPLLAAHARRSSARLWLRPLAVALAPLPLVVVLNLTIVRLLHGLLATVLPDAVSTYLVVQHGLFVLLLAALTYAAVPLLADRQARAALEEMHV